MAIIHVVVGGGTKVHAAYTWLDDRDKNKPPILRIHQAACGAGTCTTGRRFNSRMRETTNPITCEKCLSIVSAE